MMTRKGMTVALLGLAGALLVALACAMSTVPVQAQDPIGGALATLAAATANAEAVRVAQRATAQAIANEAARQRAIAAATQAAISAEATRQAQQATATAQAQSAEATRTALDELNRQRQAAATAQAQSAEGTRQAQQVTAQAIEAQATRNVVDAQATRAAYDLRIAQSQDQARLGRILLYIAAGMSLVGTAYVIATWARAIGKRLTTQVQAQPKPQAQPAVAGDGQVVDADYRTIPGSPESKERMPGDVNFVDDPTLTEAIGRWFYGGEA